MKNKILLVLFTILISSCGLFNKKDDPQPVIPVIPAVSDDLKSFKDAHRENFIAFQQAFIAHPLDDSINREKILIAPDSVVWISDKANGGFIQNYIQGTINSTLPPDSLLPNFLPDSLWQPLTEPYKGYFDQFATDYHTTGIDSAVTDFNSKCVAKIRLVDNGEADAWIDLYYRLGHFENQAYSVAEMAYIKEIASRHQKK